MVSSTNGISLLVDRKGEVMSIGYVGGDIYLAIPFREEEYLGISDSIVEMLSYDAGRETFLYYSHSSLNGIYGIWREDNNAWAPLLRLLRRNNGSYEYVDDISDIIRCTIHVTHKLNAFIPYDKISDVRDFMISKGYITDSITLER